MCGAENVHLHHTTYDRIGQEELTDLIALCPKCHADVHTLERRGEIELDFTGLESPERAAKYEAETAPARQQAHTAAVHREVHALGRTLRDKLKRIASRASEQGVDIRDELHAISELLDAADRRL
jgi:hypothetical protein